ncbi:MAG TPA: GSCFA domain-containing protein [Ohtaekwangia sp.]|uniref:GSCFA domain-containing protein n=1 Tax=Ohtaekwangia sp. TaxID=2066019 RepID=UPI002F954F30
MNPFRTTLNAGVSTHTISLSDRIITLGSCFADAIGSRMVYSKMQALANPFGVLYNPVSMHRALRYSIFNETVADHTFLTHHDVFLSYDFHSEISALQKTDLQHRLTNTIGATHHFLKDAQWILLTYGTAWVYERMDTGEIVANCHKQPAAQFRKTLLSHDLIVESFQDIYNEIKAFNPAIRIILTVSPVRHLKDTLELNSVSKSILRVACHTLQESYLDVVYFPAYEIQLDDLRDYRFYKSDMLHPTEQAEEYIWEQFATRYFDAPLKDFIERWRNIQQALHHKPFHPTSSAHQNFLKDTLRRLEELKPLVNVDEEIAALQRQLNATS